MKKTLLLLAIIFSIVGCKKTINSNLSLDREKFFTMYDSHSMKIEQLEASLDSAVDINDKFHIGLIKMAIGKKLRNQSNFSQALHMHEDAQKIAYEMEDTLMLIKSYNEAGTVFRRIDALTEAIKSHYKALQYSEMYSDTTSFLSRKQKAIALNGIGNISLVLEFYDEAEKAFRECIEIENALESNIGLAINYANLGAIYNAKDICDTAMIFYNLSLDHNSKANSQIGISLCNSYIGNIYEKEGKLNRAKEHYVRGYENIKNSTDVWHKLVLHISIARINIKQGNYSEGVSNLEQTYTCAKQISSPEHLAEIYKLWAEYYEKIGNIKRANENLKKSYQYADVDRRKKEQESLMRTNVNLITELSKEQIELQTAIIEQQEQKQNLLRFTVLVCLVAILMFIYIISSIRRKNHKLAEINDMKNRLFSVISHDLKNPALALKMSLSSINNAIDKSYPQLKEQVEMTLKATEEHVELLNNLLNWACIQGQKLKFNPVRVDLRDILNDVKISLENIAINKNISVSLSIPNKCYAEVDTFMLSTVIRNLLSNALKYTMNEGEINISVQECGVLWQISVIDNGIGMSEDQMKNLISENNSQTTAGTAGEKGTGLGFLICRDMVKIWGGTMNIESEVGKGSTFTVTVHK